MGRTFRRISARRAWSETEHLACRSLCFLVYKLFAVEGRIHDIGIVAFSLDESADSINAALDLIAKHDPMRLKRIRKDLTGGINALHPHCQYNGWFDRSSWSCHIASNYANSDTDVRDLATLIVHEATHARLERKAIEYAEEMRPRIERACMMQEVVFAKKLPEGENIVDEIREKIEYYNENSTEFTDAAFERRRSVRMNAVLRSMLEMDLSKRTIRIVLFVLKLVSGYYLRQAWWTLKQQWSPDRAFT